MIIIIIVGVERKKNKIAKYEIDKEDDAFFMVR